MPVTAKLSKLFYDRLGEEIAGELVDWFNAVDATYRTDLHQLNELNFSRFDAKLEQRVVELHAKLDTKINRVYAELSAKIDTVEAKLNAKIDRVYAELNAKIDRVAGELHAKIDQFRAELHADMAAQKSDLLKWMFAFWAGTVIPLAALMIALLH